MQGQTKYGVSVQQLKELSGFESLTDEEAENINAQFREFSLLVASIALREWNIHEQSINASSYEEQRRLINL